MSDLNALKETLLAQAREQGQAKLAAAVKEHELAFQQQEHDLLAERANRRQHQLNEVTNQHQRQLQQLKNQERQSSLKSKQEVLNQLFEGALTMMTEWSSSEHIAFFERVISQYKDQPLDLILGEQTKDAFTDIDLSRYPHLSVNPEPIKGQAGFVLSDGKVEYNYLYQSLINDTRQDTSLKLANQVFEEA
ncbi:hypothetical protein [Vaginisenegalia massiliensis]|uniref:hypothetical protein n=1 Tax=Vaginisenegalia massiliensis TaxID=2058294 RepID=UPI000F53DAB1|nr:hypothetical protein [Vaginisenegalia massiliensis]